MKREDPLKGPTVSGITEIVATTSSEVMELLSRGNRNRTMEATAANKASSRSHAVLQVSVEQRDKAPGVVAEVKVKVLVVGQCNIFDTCSFSWESCL